jgi:mannose-6-phosphate isomerase-like protein (cupin superfamily)/pyrroloquinoline quinone (PQQ) biosynthesis protein C
MQIVSIQKRRATDLTQSEALALLRTFVSEHPFWNNSLLKAIKAGHLSRADYKFIFEQYYFYSKNFTRYLSGLMANMEDDLLRSRLSENLWEEGGGAKPEERHAQIFRNFLKDALAIDVTKITPTDSTRLFVREYLDYCKDQPALGGSSFLSLGTEAIVARLYTQMVEGMLKAGIEEEHLHFFRLHMACDDAHAETLEQIMASYDQSPDWFGQCKNAADYALTLRKNFFESLYQELEYRRVKDKLQAIQGRKSLSENALRPSSEEPSPALLFQPSSKRDKKLYSNAIPEMNIEFSVERAPFGAEVLDARVVRIPAGKFNERHRHAHETVFYIISGSGRVMVDSHWVEVKPGDTVFVPRWSLHQSQNLGSDEMTILAVTDFHLTGKAFMGDYDSTARIKREKDPDTLS